MSFRLRASEYKSLAHLDWAPSGVCALVGPNGSGKTTVLWTPEVLRLALEGDLVHALTYVGGSGPVRRLEAKPEAPTEVSLEAHGVVWTLRPEDRVTRVWERATVGGLPLVERDAGAPSVRVSGAPMAAGDEMALTRAANADDKTGAAIAPLLRMIRGYRVHGDYELRVLREIGSSLPPDIKLNATGTNLFGVLQRWRDLSDHEFRWNFVTERLREAFSPFFRTFDFEPAGNVISLVVRTPGRHALRPNDWPNGFFAALLNLCAVAGSDRDGVVAIDEPETALHPSLVRFMMDAFRDWSIEHGTTVLLATHSPVVLDSFAEQPEQVYVMETGHTQLPARLDMVKKREWLKHFSLGDLYAHAEFGGHVSGNGS
jgi:energy-coupling factor transporter ATP-binding protein EcfA2